VWRRVVWQLGTRSSHVSDNHITFSQPEDGSIRLLRNFGTIHQSVRRHIANENIVIYCRGNHKTPKLLIICNLHIVYEGWKSKWRNCCWVKCIGSPSHYFAVYLNKWKSFLKRQCMWVNEDISHLLWKPNAYYNLHQSSLLVPIVAFQKCQQ